MDRMKTFGLYALGIIGFIFLSLILEDGLISGMYKPLNNTDKYISTLPGLDIRVEDAAASSVNGYMDFIITNNSSETITDKYVKLDLYTKQGLLSKNEYIRLDDIGPGESQKFKIKFKGSEITDYSIATLSEDQVPDKSYVLNFFGFEIDLSGFFGIDTTDKYGNNIGTRIANAFKNTFGKTLGKKFGIDLSNSKIFGNGKIFGDKIKNAITSEKANTVKDKAKNAWNWSVNFAKSVPWWGYVVGGGIILWFMPRGYLFGIIP